LNNIIDFREKWGRNPSGFILSACRAVASPALIAEDAEEIQNNSIVEARNSKQEFMGKGTEFNA
jgi:hypothetical protein